MTMAVCTATVGGVAAQAPKRDEIAPLAPAASRATRWDVGATPLPLRKDGFALAFPTPPPLRNRRLSTTDHLSPPASGRFEFTISPGAAALRAGLPPLAPECPVQLDNLAYVTLSFWGFDARPHTGELVVHQRVASAIVGVFRRLYAARFPIEEMRVTTAADIAAPPTGDGNNTAAFLCRGALGRRGQHTQWSAHAYGVAIDINPFQNPFQHTTLLLPELAAAYIDRTWVRPGMIRSGDVVTQAFGEIGWTWGGSWQSRRDYMHFSESGK
jgi:hypothetical protein